MIAGTVCVYDFALDLFTLCDLARRCDLLILRLDVGCHYRRDFLESILAERFPSLEIRWQFAEMKWKYSNHWHGREAMLRELDAVAPSIVLQPDADEVFGPGVDRDLRRLAAGDCDLLMFGNQMAAIDGAELPHHPPAPHCRAYRWQPGLVFHASDIRYRGFCRPTLPAGELRESLADSRVIHFARYLPAWFPRSPAKKSSPAETANRPRAAAAQSADRDNTT